jgi:hypothetical protein
MLYSLYREFSVNLSKTWKNIKRNYTLSKFLSSKSTINDFNHRNFDRVSEPLLKFRRYLYFWQNVRSSNCPFGKMSVRQNVRRQSVRSAKCLSAKRPSAKCPFGKMSFGKMSGHRYLCLPSQRMILNYVSYMKTLLPTHALSARVLHLLSSVYWAVY